RPDHAQAHNNLGSVLFAKGSFNEAATHFRRAIEISPNLADAHNNLGKLLTIEGHTKEAIEHLNRALEILPNYPDGHYNMARALFAQGRVVEAAEHYRTALDLRPEWPPALGEAAWLLATHGNDRVRNPKMAVQYAERATTLTNNRNPVLLD